MERQVEGTSSEEVLSESTISDEEFVGNDDDEWDSVSQFSVASSETTASSNSSSSVWLYFDKSPDHAPDYNVCKKCSKQYMQATSVTVLRKHLRSHEINVPTRTEKKDNKSEKPLSKKEQKEHDKYLVQWLIRNLQPFTVVDDPSFRDFINNLCSRYVLPDRHKAKGNKTNLFFDDNDNN
jgi:hypothetical protein